MKKVLMIFEDFQDSGQTQTDLKKVGFDVLAMNTVARLGDTILTFRPDIVVGNGGTKLPSLSIGQELKKLKGFRGKVILILPNGARPTPKDLATARVDILVEAPVQAKRLIEILAKQLNMDPTAVLEKFNKAKIQEHAAPPTTRASGEQAPHESDIVRVRGQHEAGMQKVKGFQEEESENVRVRGGTSAPPSEEESDRARVEAYQNMLKGMAIDTHQTSHSKAAIKARQEEMKKGWDFRLLQELDDLKRQFATALFKKSE